MTISHLKIVNFRKLNSMQHFQYVWQLIAIVYVLPVTDSGCMSKSVLHIPFHLRVMVLNGKIE